ncbi:MAG: metal ABC transporter ATP-binding protein [Planctomycetota bacterium]
MILRSSSPNASAAPFSVESLTVAYRAEPVLWDVTWSARAGAMSAIVGPNGAGKSSLLNAAVGLIPSVAGRSLFWGAPFERVRSRIAYVPQRESIDWDFPITALQVVEMGVTQGAAWLIPDALAPSLRALKQSLSGRSERPPLRPRNRAFAALARVGMEDFAKRPIGDLSGGQQQRVFLARALAQDADLYLLDEPFAGVDVGTEAVLSRELRALCHEGKTVVAVHHDLDDVADRFDDVAVLNRTLIASGPTHETLTSDVIRRTFRAPGDGSPAPGSGQTEQLVAAAPEGNAGAR